MITVIDIAGMPPLREGAAEVTRFLNTSTVGARRVEGLAYRLAPGGALGPLQAAAGYQLFYVTRGRPLAIYAGARHPLGPGCGVYCDPGEPCALENPGAEPAEFYRFVMPA